MAARAIEEAQDFERHAASERRAAVRFREEARRERTWPTECDGGMAGTDG